MSAPVDLRARTSPAVRSAEPLAREAFSRSLLAGLLALTVRAYQVVIAPLLGPRCRFHPSCSHYALEALAVHGAVRGLGLSIARVARCQPMTAGGLDPVPAARSGRACGSGEDG